MNRAIAAFVSIVLPLLVACNGESPDDTAVSEGALGSSDAKIVTATATIEDGKPRTRVTFDFEDSANDYARNAPDIDSKTMCFMGAANKVCAIIEERENVVQEYHALRLRRDTMAVASCRLVNHITTDGETMTVEARYILSHDDGRQDIDVRRVLRPCEK